MAFGLENHGLPQEKIRQSVNAAFRAFHLEHLKNRNVYELSSGERQLISILSAWAMDTDIFLFDEPTANLDFAATQQLKKFLFALKKQGKTMLLSEHRLYYLADIADEYCVMANGEIKRKYTAEEAKALSREQLHTLCLRTLDLSGIAVIFRFFPVLSGDMKLLRQSVRTRGAFVTPWQKLRALPSYIEILTVPMALRVIRIAETLSASAETRGIDLHQRKSNYISLRFSVWDMVFCVILAAAVAVGLIL